MARLRLAGAFILLLSVPTFATAAPLVVFFAPQDAPPQTAAAREALADFARTSGAPFLDLSPPPPAPPEAPRLLRRGIELYERLRWDEALEALEAAFADAAATGAMGLDASDLSDLLLYRALTWVQKGDRIKSWTGFVAAAVLDPTRVLDPARFSPKAVEQFQRATSEVERLPHGSFVLSAPAGCRFMINGREVTGAPPSLPYGEHIVRLECSGMRPFAARAQLSTQAQPFSPVLEPLVAPNTTTAVTLGREHGADSVLFARVTVPTLPLAAPILTLSRIGVSAATIQHQERLSLTLGASLQADISAAASRAMGRVAVLPSPPPPLRPRPPRWHEKPWVWAAVGALVGAAVVLPWALESESPGDTIEVRLPEEDLWP